MNEAQAKKIFDKYNPASDVVRCPNGRAAHRKALDTYARAAISLYGVIPIKELVEVFNSQNTEQTTDDEVYSLLLPLVLKKNPWYCFYRGNIAHYWAIDDFTVADDIISHHEGKPRYVPDKDEFLKFAEQWYEDENQRMSWEKIHDYIDKTWPDNYKRHRAFNELKNYSVHRSGISRISEILSKNGLLFSETADAQEFFDMLIEARNNTRIMENKGYTPSELFNIVQAVQSKIPQPGTIVQEHKKIGYNDPCPCGSGKKYKRCCRKTEEARTAQLSRSECVLFYETWYGLMDFINDKFKIINAKIEPIWPNPVSDEQIYEIRKKLWKKPKLIDEYLATTTLPPEKVTLLKSWRKHHKEGNFFLVAYTPDHAVVLVPGKNGDDRLYGVKGISRSLSNAMQRQIPLYFETVLLPFNDKIIYDSFMSATPISFGDGMLKQIQEWHSDTQVHGIITKMK
ncbi:MAG: SEC-C domain-containing protein [Clostridiales bacterium]|jgi:hypothetical protein|nr:SEC-C domain-containing protein [Clostridiales bacterium]